VLGADLPDPAGFCAGAAAVPVRIFSTDAVSEVICGEV
jgi:hypothetical protein